MRRRLTTTFRKLRRSMAGGSSHHRQAISSLALLALTELGLLTLTFCTNFISAYIHNTVEVFRWFRLRALDNALAIVSFERHTGLFFEQQLQAWHEKHLRGWSFWNTYYAGVHPVVTIVFLVFILLRMFVWKTSRVSWKRLNEGSSSVFETGSPSAVAVSSSSLSFGEMTPACQYRFLRAVWVVSAWISFAGFLFVPAMPPRLLPVCEYFNAEGSNVGACLTTEFSFIDTIGKHGSLLWDWDDESVKTLNNPYAAFPSQHTMFAAWCAMAWIMLMGPAAADSYSSGRLQYWLRGVLRWGIIVYPMVTVYCIVVTANHYVADALGGLVALGIAYGGIWLYYVYQNRNRNRSQSSSSIYVDSDETAEGLPR